MRRILAGVALLALAGCAGAASEPEPTGTRAPIAQPGGAVLAFVFGGGGRLAALDARTLGQRGHVVVGFPAEAHARSPDRGRIALGSGDGRPRIAIVDVVGMRVERTLELGGPGHVEAIAWLDETRLAVFVRHLRPRLLTLDLIAGRVVSTYRVTRDIVASASVEGALAVLVSPRRRIGPTRLLVLGREGVTRTVALDVEAGWNGRRQLVPGLALDPSGRRAVVIAAGRATEVDLYTLTTAEHELVRPVSLLGRLRDWLEPRAHAKGYPGSTWWAVFVDSRRVAITGIRSDGRRPHPLGAELVDSHGWSIRRLDADATGIVAAGGGLVAFTQAPDGLHLRVLESSGRERHRLTVAGFPGTVHAAGRYAYLPDAGAMQWAVLDLETGRRVGTGRTSGTAVILERL